MTIFPLSNVRIFEKLLDKATSPLLLEPDWETILQLCDVIKSSEVTPKYAVHSIKKKLHHENAHVILHALQCLESIVKNCGESSHREVAQKDVIEALKGLIKHGPEPIRAKVLELIQYWSHGLGQQYKIFTETLNSLKLANYRFPILKQSEAMFENEDLAPEWKDNKECFRCRQAFTTFTRKHHCRACGNIFCDKCSSRYFSLPKLGFDRDVRVCESCYEKLTTGAPVTSKPAPAPAIASRQVEIDEEESLQLALAISRSEAEEKERQKKILTQKYATTSSVSPPVEQTDGFIRDTEIDQFVTVLIDHMNNFKFRMLSDQQRHRTITTDTVVQSVFVLLQHLHPELHRFMQLLEYKWDFYENLQDKLSQLKDAREALNALRSEHVEQKQQEAFERERKRQIQLAEKLDLMKQKKQEYLEYQRQVHLQHLAQQEMDMRNHLAYQRQLISTREQSSVIFSSHQSIDPHSFHTPAQSFSSPYSIKMNEDPTTDQIPLINSTFQNKPEPQLIIFD